MTSNVSDNWDACVIEFGTDIIMKVKFSPTRFAGRTISIRFSSSELSIFSVICLLVSSKLKCLTSKFAVPSIMKEFPPWLSGNLNFRPVFSAIGTPNAEGIIINNPKSSI